MRIHVYLFLICCGLFALSCSDNQKDEYFENMEFAGVNISPPDYIKAFQDALAGVIREAIDDFPPELVYDKSWATYEYDNDIPAIVMLRYEEKYRFLLNGERLLEEGYTPDKGMLLIALHEAFHLKLGSGMSNTEGHDIMLESPEYHRWIKKYLGCRTLAEARTLALLGTEEYQRLTDEQKEFVQFVAESYYVKVKVVM